MRVLVSAESFLPSVNGVTNSVLRVIEHLDNRGHETMVIAPEPGPTTVKLKSGTVVPILRVSSIAVPHYRSMSVGLASERRINAVLRSFQPHVVHLAAPVVLGRRVGTLTARLGIPSVALFQTDLSGFVTDYGGRFAVRPIWRWLRSIHNKADLTLAPTLTMAKTLKSRRFRRVSVWGRGVDHDQFSPTRRSEAFRKNCGIETDEVLVGYVGRLAAEKRVDHLKPLTRVAGVKVVIVGDGPERSSLERKMPNATFTGFLAGETLGEAMASLDIFVHNGLHETFCQTIQEAMAAEVAVVAPNSGGPIDLVNSGVTGFLFSPNDQDVMVASVLRLVEDPKLRLRISKAARSHVAQKTWESVGDELLTHYERVVGLHETQVARSTVA